MWRFDIFSNDCFIVMTDFVKMQLIFTNLSVKNIEIIHDFRRMITGMKNQNYRLESGQNQQIKIDSFQLMEGKPSIS